VLCLLRKPLHSTVSSILVSIFPYAGARCMRIAEAVLERLGHQSRRTSDMPMSGSGVVKIEVHDSASCADASRDNLHLAIPNPFLCLGSGSSCHRGGFLGRIRLGRRNLWVPCIPCSSVLGRDRMRRHEQGKHRRCYHDPHGRSLRSALDGSELIW
jgi:hypothetical protein